VIVAVAAHLGLVIGRKKAREELARTNDILQSILSNMGDAVIVADKDNRFLVFNPAAERMFGKGAMTMPSTEWAHRYGLYLPDKISPFPHDQLPLTRSIRGEPVDNVEMFVRHEKAPHGLWTEITGRPLRGPSGDVLGGVIVCRDITQIKEEEFFRAGQSRVLEMIAADAPLADVLTSLVLLMEGQAETALFDSPFEPRRETCASRRRAESARSLCEGGKRCCDRTTQWLLRDGHVHAKTSCGD
jgi:PAS domain S-box-containing protein